MKNKAVIIVFLVIVVAVIIYFMTRGKNDKETITTTSTSSKSGLAGLDLSGLGSLFTGGGFGFSPLSESQQRDELDQSRG